jgi:transposase InsO family protein
MAAVEQAGIEPAGALAQETSLWQQHSYSPLDCAQWPVDVPLRTRPAGQRRTAQDACVLEENTRECLAIEVSKSLRSQDIILTLSQLIPIYGKPALIRSDNGAEFTATAVMKWLRDQNVGPAYIKLGSARQNDFVESFNGKLRDECLSREWFLSRQEAKLIIEKWRHFYNNERPHSVLGNRTPAEGGRERRQEQAG